MRLHYVRRGGGDPVVLLHGRPGFWYDWRHVIVPLAEEADVVALDFRGFGGSGKPEGDPKYLYTQDHLASDVLALLDHLGIRRFVVAGHDTGAVIAQVLARRAPERVSALVLFNPPHSAIGDKPQEPASQREAWYGHFHALPWSHELVAYNRDTVGLYLRHPYDRWMGNRDSVRPKRFELSWTPSPDRTRSEQASAATGPIRRRNPSGWKHSARLPIDTPTVVRWGELDPIKPPSWAEGIEQSFPNLDSRFVPGAGHFVPFEDPGETVSAIRAALSIAR